MPESFTISRVLPATPQQVYEAWLDDAQHTEMTGALATCEARVGGRFMAWEGYIEGTNVELLPYSRIVQHWRTTEFPDAAPDSILEIGLEPSNGGTLLTLTHSNVPDGRATRTRSVGSTNTSIRCTSISGPSTSPSAKIRAYGESARETIEPELGRRPLEARSLDRGRRLGLGT